MIHKKQPKLLSFMDAVVLHWQIQVLSIPRNDNSLGLPDLATRNGFNLRIISSCGKVSQLLMRSNISLAKSLRCEVEYLAWTVKFGSCKERARYPSLISWLQCSDWYPIDLPIYEWMYLAHLLWCTLLHQSLLLFEESPLHQLLPIHHPSYNQTSQIFLKDHLS